MRKKDDNTMHSVNDDSHEDLDEGSEVLILEILEDLVDLEISILIFQELSEDVQKTLKNQL